MDKIDNYMTINKVIAYESLVELTPDGKPVPIVLEYIIKEQDFINNFKNLYDDEDDVMIDVEFLIKTLHTDIKIEYKKQHFLNKSKKGTCNTILKSGKNKGNKCNRLNCKYHK